MNMNPSINQREFWISSNLKNIFFISNEITTPFAFS
jgi:hypothetical protein